MPMNEVAAVAPRGLSLVQAITLRLVIKEL